MPAFASESRQKNRRRPRLRLGPRWKSLVIRRSSDPLVGDTGLRPPVPRTPLICPHTFNNPGCACGVKPFDNVTPTFYRLSVGSERPTVSVLHIYVSKSSQETAGVVGGVQQP